MNKKFFFFVLAAAGIILTAFFLIPNSQLTHAPETSTPSVNLQSAMLVIDYGEDNPSTYSIEVTNDSTAFSILKNISEKENISLVTQQYDFGVFVQFINGKESGNEMAWIYFVNGKSGTVAADLMKVNPGDTVEWKYIPPSEE